MSHFPGVGQIYGTKTDWVTISIKQGDPTNWGNINTVPEYLFLFTQRYNAHQDGVVCGVVAVARHVITLRRLQIRIAVLCNTTTTSGWPAACTGTTSKWERGKLTIYRMHIKRSQVFFPHKTHVLQQTSLGVWRSFIEFAKLGWIWWQ